MSAASESSTKVLTYRYLRGIGKGRGQKYNTGSKKPERIKDEDINS